MNIDREDIPYYHCYTEPPKTLVKSAIRVINVLEYFYRNREPARAVDISNTLDYPVSSTKYLLTSLVDSGYLTFDKASKKYFPSILFTGFASWLSELYPSGEVLRNLARETREAFGQTVSITVQHEQHMRALIIEMEGTVTPPSYDFRVRIPLIGSAGGLVALSTLSDSDVVEYVSRESGKLPPEQRKMKIDQLMADIQQTRQQGYAIKHHDVVLEGQRLSLLVVAEEIPVGGEMPPMVLAITGARDRMRDRETDIVQGMQTLLEKYRPLLEH